MTGQDAGAAVSCWDCSGSRAVPDDFTEDGYGPCPSCVIDAGETFVVFARMDEDPAEPFA